MLCAINALTSVDSAYADAGMDWGHMRKPWYIGVFYSPAVEKIRGFKIKESFGETKAMYPTEESGKKSKFKAEDFNWMAQNPQIDFKNNLLTAAGGSAGYRMGNTRIELEVGYERFKNKSTGGKTYLLAKELAHDTVTSRTRVLAAALGKVHGEDIVRFANELRNRYEDLDKKLCKDGLATNPNTGGKCDGVGSKAGLQSALGEQGASKWPRISDGTNGSGSPYTVDSTAQISREISELTTSEKGKIAAMFVRTVEGGEVVELQEISSTSVMVNVCYDMLNENMGIVPYICAGLGGNLVGVVDGFMTPKVAYQVKGGFSYQFTHEISAFAGGYYHRVVGDETYKDLPVKRLSDDISPSGRTKDTAVANFSMAYAGAELGMRFAF